MSRSSLLVLFAVVGPVAAGHPSDVAARLDSEIDRALAAAKVPASPICTDSEFIRRATLDITGTIPTAERVVAFLTDKSPDKRRKLLDELLGNPGYGKNFGVIWHHLLIQKNADNRLVVRPAFGEWLATQFNAGRPWNEIVREILTASGKMDENPAVLFLLAHSVTDVRPGDVQVKSAEVLGTAAQRFLGTQIQCAECHNHPFTGYKQVDFWGAAAFFSKLSIINGDKDSIRKLGGIPAIRELPTSKRTIEIPESKGKIATARLPDGSTGPSDPNGFLRNEFVNWAVAPTNPTFAPATVNRLWAHFFGRGFVNPVDDFSDENPPSHPEALKLLAEELIAANFDLRHVVRCICLTNAYQRSSDALPGNATDEALFSHMMLKALSPEVMIDALETALGKDLMRRANKEERPKGPKELLLKQFRTTEEPDLPEYNQGIPQVLMLLNGGLLDNSPNLTRLVKRAKSPSALVEEIYLTALSRKPTPSETRKAIAFLAREKDVQSGATALMQVLLNSSEFILNH